jgi:hypothetical protein
MQVVFIRGDAPMPVSELPGFVTQSLDISIFLMILLWLSFRGSRVVVKLLPCEHEVMGSSTGKSLL